jgi:hypothetical protein
MGLVARFFFYSVSVVGAVPWANDFFLPFISLRNADYFSNRRARLEVVLTVFTGGFARLLVMA